MSDSSLSDTGEPVLIIHQLNAAANDVSLLRNIDLSLQPGEILALCGPNGAGKSSLLRSISGDLLPQSGSIKFSGLSREQFGVRDYARSVAYLPQISELGFPFESQQVVAMGRTPHSTGTEIDDNIAVQAMREFDISELAKRQFTRLSGGEKQRVQLARVLCQLWRAEDANSRLLLLDEPCNALDVAHTHQLMRSLQRFAAEGVGIIMVLHDLNLAVRYADRLAVMSQGAIAALGEAQAVLSPELMQEIFKVQARLVTDPESNALMVCIDA